jgi:hypothetical protein
MELSEDKRRGVPLRIAFRPLSGYTSRTEILRRWKAPMFWKTGRPPGLSRY